MPRVRFPASARGSGTAASLARAKAAADEAAVLMRQRQQAGTATLIDLLDAERQQIAAAQNLSQAMAGLTGDYVSIQKAMGLGWSAPDAAAASGPGEGR